MRRCQLQKQPGRSVRTERRGEPLDLSQCAYSVKEEYFLLFALWWPGTNFRRYSYPMTRWPPWISLSFLS